MMFNFNEEKNFLSLDVKKKIDCWLKRYPEDKRRSAVMAALRIVQDENFGFLNLKLMDCIAIYLKIPKIFVYEVATFYSMYEFNSVGKYKICVCTNVSCMLSGSGKIVEYLKKKLGISFGEITSDGKFSLKEVECLAACGNAPVIQIGNNYYEDLNFDKVDSILSNLD